MNDFVKAAQTGDTHDGKEYVETVKIELTGKDTMKLGLVEMCDGKEDQNITGVFHRKSIMASK